ncbi:unnamed protein product [Mytilus coruscus]|uniref:Uncharacterized protein n=1 Tax=Mytilus coruscus TaxID=42192 RepID=A0A6J8A703_MYTCO|nr:unnamed protein product [Mytilus coruscus]
MFHFLCFYFGSKYQRELIEFASTRVIRERTQLMSLKEKCSEFKIHIEEEFEHSYFSRLTGDLAQGKVHDVFNDSQMVLEDFHQKFISFIRQKSKEEKTALLQSSEITCFDERSLEPDTPLSIAFLCGYKRLAQFIMSFISNVNEGNFKPLRAASLTGNDIIVDLLLKNGADVNAIDEDGWTCLMSACQSNSEKVIRMMVLNGSNVNHQSNDRNTPIIVASEVCERKVLEFLVEHGASINSEHNNGCTPLMKTCIKNRSDIVDFLLQKGANANHQDKNG